MAPRIETLRRMPPTALLLAALLAAMPAAAQLRPLVEPPASPAAAAAGVDVYLLNEGAAPAVARGPESLVVTAGDGTRLELSPASDDPPVSVAPGGFARLRYRLAGQVASLPPGSSSRVAPPPTEVAVATSRGSSSGFVSRFRTNEPIYGVFGTSGAGGKLQVGFGFRAIGPVDGVHLDFAYTQTMFWALGEPSAPFTDTNYAPELIVDIPLGRRDVLGVGYRHDSNGEGPATSVDANRLIARLTHRVALGGGWVADVTPSAWFYVGEQGIARDLDRYWGYTALGLSIGRDGSLKLDLHGRGNPGTGRGALEGFLSYPLTALDRRLPPIYLFGQAFTGYGEAMSDYNRRSTYARLGIALTR